MSAACEIPNRPQTLRPGNSNGQTAGPRASIPSLENTSLDPVQQLQKAAGGLEPLQVGYDRLDGVLNYCRPRSVEGVDETSWLLSLPEPISVSVATDPPAISEGGQNGIFPPKVSVCGNNTCCFRDPIDHLLRPTRPAQHNRLCSRRALRGPDRQMDTVATPVAQLPFQAGRHTAATEAQHHARRGLTLRRSRS
jgi:hypothetical protein